MAAGRADDRHDDGGLFAVELCGSGSRPRCPPIQASRKVVVTVENTRIISAAMPSPALTMMTAMSYSPVKMAAPMPMTYIQQDTSAVDHAR